MTIVDTKPTPDATGNHTSSANEAPTKASMPASDVTSISIGSLVVALLAVTVASFAWITAIGNKSTGGPSVQAAIVKAVLTDFKVTLDRTTVPAGFVTLKVTNKAATVHNLHLEGARGTRSLGKGKSQTVDLGQLEPGKYELICLVPGHKDVGMIAELTVIAGGGATDATADAPEPVADWKAVDAAHQRVVKDFLAGPPAKTAGLGGQPIVAKMENGVPVYDLTTAVVQWEVKPGVKYEAWTYNGTVPGPEFRVKQGETIKIRVHNKLPESTSIHFHGLEIADNKQDGVTFVTQDPIKPGDTYTYTLTPINCGSHMYHSHHSADAQVPLGLLGSFVVGCVTTPVPAFAAHSTEYTEVLTDGPLGFGINGKSFPATPPVVSKVGEKTLIRFMNEGLIIHPMHLHGHPMLVVAKDGNYLPAPYLVDTINIAPGERYDVIIESKYPGAWAFHCHILTHAESPQGLHGMTTVWVVQA
jgi:manganese oxidase